MSLSPRLLSLATATGQLTAAQVRLIGACLDRLDAMNARRTAMEGAVAILDPGQGLSRWALALALESRLKRFDGLSRRRVLAGYRPATALEIHLLVLLESGPRCASKLWEELRCEHFPPARGKTDEYPEFSNFYIQDSTMIDPDSYIAGYRSGTTRPEHSDTSASADADIDVIIRGMRDAELLRQRAQRVIHEERPFDPDAARRDWRHALRDGMALRHGVRVDRPHPFAAELVDMPFQQMARAVGVGLTTSDFSEILTDGYSLVLPTLTDSNPADYLVRDQFVSNYKNFSMGTIDYQGPHQLFEETIPPFQQFSHQAVSGQLLEYAITIRLSLELLIDDSGHSRGLVDEMIRQSVQLLARQDLILIAAALEANGTLGDGNPLFGTANTVSGATSANITHFSSAINKLQTQVTTQGNLACAEPAILLVSPDWYCEWAVALSAIFEGIRISLASNPYLASKTAYLLADPKKTTSLVRLRMRGSTGPKLWPMAYLPGWRKAYLQRGTHQRALSDQYRARFSFGHRQDWSLTMIGYWHTEKDEQAPARAEPPTVYSDNPRWQIKPLSLDLNDPVVRHFLWYRGLTPEQRVDAGLPPDEPATAKRRKPLLAE